MSWMTDLAELYDKQFGQEGVLPLYHSTAMAHVEVVIDEDGGFVSANRISEKSLSETMIPVTEESESRTSGITPHPIVDGAKYLVKGLSDHIKPGGKKKEKSTEAYYDAYVDQLQRWIESGYGCPDVLSIYQYVSKGCMFEDLVQSGVYTLDDDGYFTDEKVLGSDQDKVVIRFLIQRGGKDPEKIWLNKSLQEANIAFNRNCFKKTEQNRVWVGLSKETAHQLGTPISSLMAWTQMLESMGVDKEIITDMDTDVHRLSVIADRFSKIGSMPDKELTFINEAVESSLAYMRTRIPKHVTLTVHTEDDKNCGVMLCQPLFEWVMENLTKNAVDAMSGQGRIDIVVTSDAQHAHLYVKDTGKGIPRKNFKNVFNPGFTTKKRGWGLGLTLVKRIIEEYHGGKIFVKESEVGKGTTFSIEIPKVK